MKKVFESINLDIQEIEDFIEENGLSFICNDKMQVEASEEDFDKLIAQFPELDYVEADDDTINVFETKRAIYSVSRNEDGTLTIIREYILNNGYWHKDGNLYKNAGLLIVQNGGVDALLSKCEAVEDIKQHVQSMNAERKASAKWAAEDNMKAKAAFEAAFSQEVTEATPENISTLLRYLNTVNWGVWELPKMTVGYVCHQYDCDGKTATTIKLDTPVMFFEKPETMFVYGNPRGHLANYTKIG